MILVLDKFIKSLSNNFVKNSLKKGMGKLVFHGILSGNWNNGVNCGSRSSNWNNSPLNLNSNNSARRVADTDDKCYGRKLNSPLADQFTLSLLETIKAKYTTTAPTWASKEIERPCGGFL